MGEYKFFQTTRGPDFPFAAVLRYGTERYKQSSNPFRLAVIAGGISINGFFGTNPSKEEMKEMLELMREAVAKWDESYG